jgi:ATP-dependent DNA ligase
VPAHKCPSAAFWRAVAARNQVGRLFARKDGNRVRLYSRPGNDLTYRFPLIVEALAGLRPQSCIIDGEAVACGEDGIPAARSTRRAQGNPRQCARASSTRFTV